ncbi:hypothetical protein UFOVP49_48 [uncultured Caudovirales phage]|uniref:Uncharacterized protein n=1 Tax=uncultured Caudovirales phage TaxID=2100421 RepID=A0A6J5KT11_9CAUD|nr:hypothetical protein UFOVP49_48 [uncultured Caudovirales phage]
MTHSELVTNLKSIGLSHYYNSGLKLWQIFVDDLVLYIAPKTLEGFASRDELEAFISNTMVDKIENGLVSEEIPLH